jgi:hypothetical protein
MWTSPIPALRLLLPLSFVALLALPAPVFAANEHAAWMAVWDQDGSEFRRSLVGLLTLRDGTLTFKADNGLGGWEIQMADVKRIAVSEGYGKWSYAIELESLTGEKEYVAIMDGQLLMASPKKVVKVLEEALGEARAAAK